MFPLGTSVILRSPPVMGWLLIAVNAVAFLVEVELGPERLAELVQTLGVVPANVLGGGEGAEPQRFLGFLTSMFLHGGWLHLIGNMWTLWVFGPAVEDRMGSGRFLLFYLACGILASGVHVAVEAHSDVPSIGASGAIAGVMGAFLLLHPKARVVVLLPILFLPFIFDFTAVLYLGYWFLLQLASGTFALTRQFAEGGIAFWAHVGGFVAGALLVMPFLLKGGRWRYYDDEGGFHHAWTR